MVSTKEKTTAVDTSGYKVFSVSHLTGGKLDVARLRALCQSQLDMEDELERKEAEVKEVKARLRLLSEDILPQLFEENGVKDVSLDDGSIVKISPAFRAGIEKGHEEEAFAYVERAGAGNIVKNTFTIVFGKNEEKAVKKFIRDLNRRKNPLHWEIKRAIHNQTLCAWIKERVQSSLPLDFWLFNAVEVRKTKIKRKD